MRTNEAARERIGDDDEAVQERALVVDELALVRAGIDAILRYRGIEIAAETRSGREALSLAVLEHPHVVVMGTPADVPIAETARRFLALRPRPAVVVLLPPAYEHVVGYLVAMGVHGVGLRAGDPEELGTLVDAALKGAQMVAPTLHGALAGSVKPRPLAEREEPLLTSREREVLVLLSEGRNNREIAAAMSVSLPTVKSHLVRVYAKLQASNRNEALGRAVSLGLLG
jgi:DNA-binding NarL/FixJ family response regulator